MDTADYTRAEALRAWAESGYGRYAAAWAAGFFVPPPGSSADARVLQLGLPQWPLLRAWPPTAHRVCQNHCLPADVLAAADCLPWPEYSFDTVLLPHSADVCGNTAQLLAEAYRVLVPGGCILLSGLNALGYWRFGARALSCRLVLHSAGQMRHALEQAGFRVCGGRFMAYAAPWQRPAAQARNGAVEKMGHRWWPHWAAVYALTAVKDMAGVHPDADLAAVLRRRPGLDWAAAVGRHRQV